MTDTELIAAVAKRLGWKKPRRRSSQWIDPKGNYRKLPYNIRNLLNSVDAALGVLGDLDYSIEKRGIVHTIKLPNVGSQFVGGDPVKSLPRAILLAFLEAKP